MTENRHVTYTGPKECVLYTILDAVTFTAIVSGL